ncbi:hypothetical protein RUND412_005935 [Rhizina undulata]
MQNPIPAERTSVPNPQYWGLINSINRHRVLPRKVYRVYGSSSASVFDQTTGFVAANVNFVFDCWNNYSGLVDALEQHAVWSNRIPTPFISVTSSYNHVCSSAQARERRGRRNVRVAEINTTALLMQRVRVLRMRKLVKVLNLSIPPRANGNVNEYLCLFRIPRFAVNRVYTVDEFSWYCYYLNYYSYPDKGAASPSEHQKGPVYTTISALNLNGTVGYYESLLNIQ